MQGELSEIDIRSILQLVELGQRTGQLLVENYISPTNVWSISEGTPKPRSPIGQSWLVFFLNGQIIYAGEADAGLSRLRGHLRRFGVEAALDKVSLSAHSIVHAPEYGCLWALLESRSITPDQARSLLRSLVRETLFDLLSLHQGYFIFEMGAPLSPQLTTLEITPLVAQSIKQVQEWKQFYPHLQSPEQCPVIVDAMALQEVLPSSTLTALLHHADGHNSLRQIARSLHRDLVTVAKAIYPCVQRGWIQMSLGDNHLGALRNPTLKPRQSAPRSNQAVPRIVCLDDAATVRATVADIVQRYGYEIHTLEHPVQGLSQLFELKPDLILCDIEMPALDGYEVCAMLRQSTIFRQTPIVMLTGKDGFIDRVRAHMAGATDYLAKPFGEEELIMLLEKYVGPGSPEESQMAELSRLISSPSLTEN